MLTHRQIAETVLGCTISDTGHCPCPGAHRHTTPTGPRDFRITFDPTGQKMPSGHCFHASCEAERHNAMVAIIRAIRHAQRNTEQGTTHTTHTTTYRPRHPRTITPPAPPRPQLDPHLVEQLATAYPTSAPEKFILRTG